jgi:hypothetical protein
MLVRIKDSVLNYELWIMDYDFSSCLVIIRSIQKMLVILKEDKPIYFVIFRLMRLLLILLTYVSLIACSITQPRSQAEKIVDAAIIAHGGLEHWQSLHEMKFRKKTWLYRSDNSLEKHSDEIHTIRTGTTLEGTIEPYDTKNNDYSISFANGKGVKNTNQGTVDGTKAFLASHFVVNQPFKLLDPGLKLTYLGIDTLADKEPVDVIKAEYGAEDDDTWWFYFDRENNVLLATLIYHAPTYAFVVNENIELIDGILWNTKRTTYRTDSLRNIEYIRAKFEYSEISAF